MWSRVTYRTARQSAEVLSTGQSHHSQQCRHQISGRSHFGNRSRVCSTEKSDVANSRRALL